MSDLSVVIVSYNTSGLLRDCLRSVDAARGMLSLDVVVVDNRSTDDSCGMMAREFPNVRLMRNTENRGFAAANNQGLAGTRGRYVLLLNSDTIVRAGAFETMVAFMDGHPRAGYCGPRLVNADGSYQASAHRFPTVFSRVFSLTGLAERHPRSAHCLDLHASQGDDRVFRADWVKGACLLVRREALEQVGPLDEGYFMYFEETDWCGRMAAAGWEGWYVADAEVVHLGGASVRHDDEVRVFSGNQPVYWVRSHRRYLRRHHGVIGMAVSETLEILVYCLVWLRHRWRRNDRSREKARSVATAIRYKLVGA